MSWICEKPILELITKSSMPYWYCLHWKCELARIINTKYIILRFGFWCNQIFTWSVCDGMWWWWVSCIVHGLMRMMFNQLAESWGEITKGESWLSLHSWPPAGPWSHMSLSLIVSSAEALRDWQTKWRITSTTFHFFIADTKAFHSDKAVPDNIYSVKSAGERIGGCLGMTGTVWPSWTVTARESSGTARTTSSRAAPRQKVSQGIF